MPFPITDEFADSRGRWNQYVPYTTTERCENQASIIPNQEHIDISSFTDQVWKIEDGSTGLNHDLIIGKLNTKGGWRGLEITTNGAALNATLTRSIPGDNLDISHLHTFSAVFSDYNSFNRSSSYVQMTSHPEGTFDAGLDSNKVYFNLGDVQPIQLALNLALFDNNVFDDTKICGIRFHLEQSSPPPAETVISIMALRALAATWVESALDFNTRHKNLQIPVSLNGQVYQGDTLRQFEFIRGNGGRDDPIPVNGTYTLVFNPGGELISDLLQNLTGILGRERLARFLLAGVDHPTLSAITNYNHIALIARKIDFEPEPETEDGEDSGTGSYLRFNLLWNSDKTLYYTEKVTDSEDDWNTEILDHNFIDVTLNPLYFYTFSAKLVGNSVELRIAHVDQHHIEIANVWSHTFTSDDLYVQSGRVGFMADLFYNDATIEAYVGAPTSFARLVSQTFVQRTPVDGGQLAAVSASDMNLYTSTTGLGDDLALDPTKTLSGFGSWRTSQGLITNLFTADDWNQMYLRLAIWVEGPIDHVNQPSIALTTAAGNTTLPMEQLQPFQWNYLNFDLGLFHRHLEGLEYQFSVLPSLRGNLFWVDNIFIGRRRVAWSMRTKSTAPFRYFWNTINYTTGALHLLKDERDIDLQYQAEALTEDAWVINPNLFPRHAQLGMPLYDENFETR